MIYLDNAATTKPFDYIERIYKRYSDNFWFNPSSGYVSGIKVKNLILESKEFIKNKLNLNNFYLYYTFSGTFSNNTIISYKTLNNIKKDIEQKEGKKITNPEIIVGIWEHSSIINPIKQLEGFKIIYLDLKEIYKNFIKINRKKSINSDTDYYDKNYNKKTNYNKEINNIKKITNSFVDYLINKFTLNITTSTIFITCMWVHNETGMIFPVSEIAKAVKSLNKNIFFHVDATQGFMKLPFFDDSNIDSITAAAHKFHSIRGVGFLFVKNPSLINPLIFGGGQEDGIVPSTENVFSILATYEVIKNEFENLSSYLKNTFLLKNYFKKSILKIINETNKNILFFDILENSINNLIFDSHSSKNNYNNNNDINKNINNNNKNNIKNSFNFSPYINRIYIKDSKAEVIVNALSNENIFISAGSACSSNAKKKVNGKIIDDNTIFGIPDNYKEGAIRISFGYFSSKNDIEKFADKLIKILKLYF